MAVWAGRRVLKRPMRQILNFSDFRLDLSDGAGRMSGMIHRVAITDALSMAAQAA